MIRNPRNPARVRMGKTEPFVDQGVLNGWILTWNPDDNRFYGQKGDKVVSFQDWMNLTYYARKH